MEGQMMPINGSSPTGGTGTGGTSPTGTPATKRRRKNDGEPSEPRRLRRSHEACTRCRGKKIKCDSKHPRCTACVTAGVPCNQEDRHRQTTIARDHTERLEQVLAQCDAILKRHLPGFTLENIEDACAREGIDTSALQPIQTLPQHQSGSVSPTHPPPSAAPPPGTAYFGYYSYMYPPPPPPSFPQGPTLIPGQDPKSNDVSSTQAIAKSFGVAPSIVQDASTSAASPVPVYPYPPPPVVLPPVRLGEEDLAVGSSGLDSGRDRVVQLEMPAPRDTAKWRVVSVFRSHPAHASSMDIWIPNDRTTLLDIVNVYFVHLNPHRPVFFRHQFLESLNQLYDEGPMSRPVFDPGFICSLYLVLALGTLVKLNRSGYQGEVPPFDGDVTMDEDSDGPKSPRSRAKGRKAAANEALGSSRVPPDWPAHDEFFDRALAVKPELRVTLSSLQALILLHWYLYAERQGRTLWRLVGSIVQLAIELGLHHDPTTQMMPHPHPPVSSDDSESTSYSEIHTFTPLECVLRIRLWSIVLVHDRGTSILLGRPLAIAPSDANTPRPSQPRVGDPVFTSPSSSHPGSSPPSMNDLDVSEHFILSAPIAEIQADIIISLYSPTRQSGETLLRNAKRIIKSINIFRRSLPPSYHSYFTGTHNWPLPLRHNLLSSLTESTGLTLLKLAISRILLLRALFSSKELGYHERKKALVDAIVQAHNVIAIHTVLVKFPEVGFFTSPVPLHIAAMVILYGRMSKCDEGIPGLSDLDQDGCTQPNGGTVGNGNGGGANAVRILMEDVWLALDMLPRFRWRWETAGGSGAGGGGGASTNPLIAKLAEKVMEASFSEDGVRGIGPPGTASTSAGVMGVVGAGGGGGGSGDEENEDKKESQSRLITGIGRQGPVGQPVLIPELEWEEDSIGNVGVSPGRDRDRDRTMSASSTPTLGSSSSAASTISTGWDPVWNGGGESPKSQQTTPTLQAAATGPGAYPGPGYTNAYPPHAPHASHPPPHPPHPSAPPASTTPTTTTNPAYPHPPPQYAFNPTPPVFGPQPLNTNDKVVGKPTSSKATQASAPTPTSATPTTPTRANMPPTSASASAGLPSHMVEVPNSLFYPFYADVSVPVPFSGSPTNENPSGLPSPSHAAPGVGAGGGGSGGPGANNLLSPPPPPARVTRTAPPGLTGLTSTSNAIGGAGIGGLGGIGTGTASSLLAAVAVQAHAHGGQQGAPDMYMSEERVVHPQVAGHGHGHAAHHGYVHPSPHPHPHSGMVGGYAPLGPGPGSAGAGSYHPHASHAHPPHPATVGPHGQPVPHYTVPPPGPSGSQHPSQPPDPQQHVPQGAHPHPPSSHLHHPAVVNGVNGAGAATGAYGQHPGAHGSHGSMPPPPVWASHHPSPSRPNGYAAPQQST